LAKAGRSRGLARQLARESNAARETGRRQFNCCRAPHDQPSAGKNPRQRHTLAFVRVIKPVDFNDNRVKALLTQHLERMHQHSPQGHVFALDWSGLQTPDVSCYALWDGEELLGIGALRELEPRLGEIKSMRTADAHLRTGVGVAILEHIIAEARTRGYARLSLETGSGAVFEPALTLYRKYGFTSGPAFGSYRQSAFNQFFHLDLYKYGESLSGPQER